MAQVPFTSFYLGPFEVYTSPSGMTDPILGTPYLGGTLHEGDYCALTAEEASEWNQRFGSNLYPGRYRFVRISSAATAANIGFGYPAGWGLASTVAQVVLGAAGSGATTDGSYTITSSSSGGTAPATATATVSGGAITAVQLTYAGAGFTSVPTFGLTEIAGLTGGVVLAQMANSPNYVSSYDSSSVAVTGLVRGVFLTKGIKAAQITANAWGVIQESGVAPVNVTSGTSIAVPGTVSAGTGGAVTAEAISTTYPEGYFGNLIDAVGANVPQLARVALNIPIQQG